MCHVRLVRRCYDVDVRTTIDLTPEAYDLAKSVARDKQQSLGKAISELITGRMPLADAGEPPFTIQRNGMPLFRSRRPTTTEDVNYAKDEEWLYEDNVSA